MAIDDYNPYKVDFMCEIRGKEIALKNTLNELIQKIIDTENAQVIDSLCKLGWTPPKDKPKKLKKLCFDIDNTFAMHHDDMEDYVMDSKPDFEMIEQINRLHDLGYEITLYTARKMESSGHDIGRATARAKGTFEWLDKYGVKYHKIYFGKPNADMYFDDKSSGWNRETALQILKDMK